MAAAMASMCLTVYLYFEIPRKYPIQNVQHLLTLFFAIVTSRCHFDPDLCH